jgi:dGTPase
VGPVFRTQVALLKELTWCYVIQNPALAALQCGQRRVIRTLFAIYTEAADRQEGPICPARFRDDALELADQHGGKLPSGERARLVADVIASLTDQQALLLFQRLTGLSSGPVLDPITT